MDGYRELVKANEEEKAKQRNEGMGRSQSTLAGSDDGMDDCRFKKNEDGQTKEDRIAHAAA